MACESPPPSHLLDLSDLVSPYCCVSGVPGKLHGLALLLLFPHPLISPINDGTLSALLPLDIFSNLIFSIAPAFPFPALYLTTALITS